MVEEPKVLFSPLELIKAAGIGVLKLISYLPFPVLYGLSGLFAFILQHVVRYRKDVIVNNLRHAFPDYTDKQIASTVNKFYRHFGDITVETIKAYSLSHDEFKKESRSGGRSDEQLCRERDKRHFAGHALQQLGIEQFRTGVSEASVSGSVQSGKGESAL